MVALELISVDRIIGMPATLVLRPGLNFAIDIGPRYWDPAPLLTISALGYGVGSYMLDFPTYYMRWELGTSSARCSLHCICGTGFKDNGFSLACDHCSLSAIPFSYSPYYIAASPEASLQTYVSELVQNSSPHLTVFDQTMGGSIVTDLIATLNAELTSRI